MDGLILTYVSGDGDCVLDMVKAANVHIAEATGLDLITGAHLLLNKCVRDGKGQAGVIKGIGNHMQSSCNPRRGLTYILIDRIGIGGSIGIGVKRYYPEHVECGGYDTFPDGCTRLVVS